MWRVAHGGAGSGRSPVQVLWRDGNCPTGTANPGGTATTSRIRTAACARDHHCRTATDHYLRANAWSATWTEATAQARVWLRLWLFSPDLLPAGCPCHVG